jgi:hypothetical protein
MPYGTLAYYRPYSASTGARKWVGATPLTYAALQGVALVPPPSYDRSVTAYRGIEVGGGQWTNRSGSTCVVALAVPFRPAVWGAAQVDSTFAVADDTIDAQDVGADDVLLHDGDDSGSGILLHAKVPFNCIAVLQGVAGDQDTPVMIYEYFDGSARVALTTTLYTSDTLATGTGEKLILYPMPHNWVKGGPGDGEPQDEYNLWIRQTNVGAGVANPTASQIFLGEALSIIPGVLNNTQTAILRDLTGLRFPTAGDMLLAVFSTGSALNSVQIDARYYEPE